MLCKLCKVWTQYHKLWNCEWVAYFWTSFPLQNKIFMVFAVFYPAKTKSKIIQSCAFTLTYPVQNPVNVLPSYSFQYKLLHDCNSGVDHHVNQCNHWQNIIIVFSLSTPILNTWKILQNYCTMQLQCLSSVWIWNRNSYLFQWRMVKLLFKIYIAKKLCGSDTKLTTQTLEV